MVSNCNRFYKIKDGFNCESPARKISVTVISQWNSIGGAACTLLWKDTSACVGTVEYVASAPTISSALSHAISSKRLPHSMWLDAMSFWRR
jgi:hypothetical protein